jgi:enoyl-CoA hydratase/carnithine racemase
MSDSSDILRVSTAGHVTTITMDDDRRLNGWTDTMMRGLQRALATAAADDDTKVVILTAKGRYYSAGVNLSGTLKLAHPRVLREQIIKHNQALFDMFIDFKKPILVAVNGHAIGAPVTSATLCDAMIASTSATFSTPFHRLGVVPEGCSSVHFERLMNAENATRMLGPEGWKPTATEAAAAGLITAVVADDQLDAEARRIADGWAAEGKTRSFRAGATHDELKAINARESIALATAFLSPPFLKGQLKFLMAKKKHGPALMFATLLATRPLWSLALRK